MNALVPPSFRGCVYVRKNGKEILRICQGMRDLANELPNNFETRFPTASAGKAFVAIAVLQLIEKGNLSLDTRLGDVLPYDLGKIDRSVTVRQLLTHTSGVPDYFDESVMDDYAELWQDFPNYRIRKNNDLFPLFFDKPMMYTPGERFQYNNSGFVLLASVLEERTGIPFDEHLRARIFEPAGMTRTGYYEMDRLPGNCANAYIWDDTRQEYYTNIYSVDAKGTGCGGAYTTVGDCARFWDALLGGKLISAETFSQMISVQAESEGDDPYGFGLWLKRRKGAILPYFTGCDPGVSFISVLCPEEKLDITAVSNFGDDAWALRDALLDAFMEEKT